MYVIMMPWVQMQVLRYVCVLVIQGYMGLTVHVMVIIKCCVQLSQMDKLLL